jgi:hypothetical protein
MATISIAAGSAISAFPRTRGIVKGVFDWIKTDDLRAAIADLAAAAEFSCTVGQRPWFLPQDLLPLC